MGHSGSTTEPSATVRPFPSKRQNWTNDQIVSGIIQNSSVAGQALFEKYHARISARVRRLMGPDSEWEDLIQQIFLTLIKAIHNVREPELLDRWIDRITVNAVRKEFRRRRRRWYLTYVSELPETEADPASDSSQLFRRTSRVLEGLPADERIAFVLRFVMEEELAPISRMCGWSLSTTKRRISRARDNFLKRAARDPMLYPMMEGFQDE